VLSRVAGLGLATAVIAGTTVGLVAPAEAAAKAKCTTGTWQLVGEHSIDQGTDKDGQKFRIVTRGAAGVKVKFSGTKATYDFTGSKKETITGHFGDDSYEGWIRYTGSLSVTVKLSGGKKGTFTVKNRTAKGNAIAHAPSGKSYDLDAIVRQKNRSETLIAYRNKAAFTCSAKKLVLVSTYNDADGRSRTTLTYRRV